MEPATIAILGSGLASAFGNVYSNTLNAANAAQINQKNLDLQAAINLDNIEAARLNNVTAVDLANTAHQREVRDLRDAGLNPILSATGGNGAATPSLQSPNLDAPSLDRVDVVNPLSQIASAVGQAMQFEDQHKLSKLQGDLLGSQGVLLKNSMPSPNLMKQQANLEASSAVQRAMADNAQAEYDHEIAELRLKLLTSGLYESISPDGSVRIRHKSGDVPNMAELVLEGMISDMKNAGNVNWRNNLGAFVGALNSGASAAATIKGMRNPQAIGSRTTLPNGKTVVTEKLFK